MAAGTLDPNASPTGNDVFTPSPDDSNEATTTTEIISDKIDSLPKCNQIPLLAEYLKKKALTSTPGLDGHYPSRQTSNTPRSERISRMIPGNDNNRSLTTILTTLVLVANSVIQLPAKGRIPSRIQVDVELCADILVLINAEFNRNQLDNTRKALFHKPVSSDKCPTRVAVSLVNPTPNISSAQDSQISSLVEKFDVLSKKVLFLVSSLPALTSKTPQIRATASNPGSYAANTAKAPQVSAPAQPTRPRASPRAGSSPVARKRTVNTVTLTQLDQSQVALGDLSITQLIQGFNNAFGLSDIRVSNSDKSTTSIKQPGPPLRKRCPC
ncbi:hypothetical protein DFH28DRAFT_938294 [Melampsora americana]|nr:hypothetical protein DFH28DRAFT_938294 [Melampsora americana]